MTSQVKQPIKEVIEDFEGTCGDFSPEDYTIEELRELDAAIRLCDGCGWWVATHECVINDDGQNCEDCSGGL